MSNTILHDLRTEYLTKICKNILGYRLNKDGKPTDSLSIADSSSKTSKKIAKLIAEKINLPLCINPPEGQTAGSLFGQYTRQFLESSFKRLKHLRPGDWEFSTYQDKLRIAKYDQYEHIAKLAKFVADNKELAAILGSEYMVTPDILVARKPVSDSEINIDETVVSDESDLANMTSLRATNYDPPLSLLHATISCKWTMRSDRSQNTRTEALNLIRNRKGRTPHIVAVIMEPTARRISSIALGTGDIDCTYHGALHELIQASEESENEDQIEMLNTLIDGRRLRDISDLPFDLLT